MAAPRSAADVPTARRVALVISDDPCAGECWRQALTRLDLASRIVAPEAAALVEQGKDARARGLVFVDLRHGLDLQRTRALHGPSRRPALLVGFADTPERAVEAFELQCHGFYLGRPEPGGVRECLRAAARRRLQEAEGHGHLRGGDAAVGRVLLRSRSRMLLVSPEEIDWIVADRNYVVFRTPSGSHRVRGTLGHWAAKLDRRRFVRVDRSTIVHVERLEGLRRDSDGRTQLLFRGGRRLPATPTQLGEVLGRLLAAAGEVRRERDTLER